MGWIFSAMADREDFKGGNYRRLIIRYFVVTFITKAFKIL